MAQVEIYLATGVIVGTLEVADDRRSAQLEVPFSIDDVRWYPSDGRPAELRRRMRILPDDVFVVTGTGEVRSHAIWHPVTLHLGPYRLTASLGTPPGLDPDRALARPKSQFVALRDARIELTGRPDANVVERPDVLINRYLVDHVAAPLVLASFFPGATTELEAMTASETGETRLAAPGL